jgi:hypothetical protein
VGVVLVGAVLIVVDGEEEEDWGDVSWESAAWDPVERGGWLGVEALGKRVGC